MPSTRAVKIDAALPLYARESTIQDLFGVPVGTLRAWRERGLGPPYGKLGRIVVYNVADFRRWIEETLEDSPPPEAGDRRRAKGLQPPPKKAARGGRS